MVTNPLAMLAKEYIKIDPKSTLNLPFLSPIMPQIIPPINKPIICTLMIISPLCKTASAFNPNEVKLGFLIIPNSNKSYTSTKKPNAPTKTGKENIPYTFCEICNYFFLLKTNLTIIGAVVTKTIPNTIISKCNFKSNPNCESIQICKK